MFFSLRQLPIDTYAGAQRNLLSVDGDTYRARMIEHRDLGAARDGKSSEILQIPVSRVGNKFPVTSLHRRLV